MLRHILAMILVAALGSLQAAHARISPDFLQALEMLQEFYDAGSTLADGAAAAAAGPMAVDDDVVEALHKKLELVSRHRVQRRVPPFPIKTARAFSPDLAVREKVRREYRDFLKADQAEIDIYKEKWSRLRAERDRWRSSRDELLAMQKTIERILEDPIVNGYIRDLAYLWFDISTLVAPKVTTLAAEYDHRLDEYERAIEAREAEHRQNLHDLEVLEVIHGVRSWGLGSEAEVPSAGDNAPPAARPSKGAFGGDSLTARVERKMNRLRDSALEDVRIERREVGRMRETADAILNSLPAAALPGPPVMIPGSGGDGFDAWIEQQFPQ
ncbi:hypothetical protein JL100_030320 (plasmid) [Skermanella mucosa]|uniref:hypothetical protein n=1 Tax=Skermanella mucosa TaxID=1789672 RepID=UPI00192C408D|nr:hypothetical protein [Skermanella mucosa]UEM24525.1 hypothetical protein JL100_030320 [Skermanella mucosa]